MFITDLEEKIYQDYMISKKEALFLIASPLDQLCEAANRIRMHFCGNQFDICAIINAKSGRCPENCRYCAQSSHYNVAVNEYPLLDADTLVEQAVQNAKQGVLRYSIVTSGRSPGDSEISSLCEAVQKIRNACQIEVCVSSGLLNERQYHALKKAGASRAHNNLEASERFFPNICTTHTTADKIAAISAAKTAGMQVCSGGIIGLGETMEDRIDLAITLRDLNIRSVPVNILNPIPGTPLENQTPLSYDEILRTIAIFRFLLPRAAIRLAGGRGLMPDHGKACFLSGANAAISGDMLTTYGITIEKDLKMIAECGYEPGMLV